MPRQDLLDRFVAVLKELGGSAGNGRLREALGWSEDTYESVRTDLRLTAAECTGDSDD